MICGANLDKEKMCVKLALEREKPVGHRARGEYDNADLMSVFMKANTRISLNKRL